MAGMFGIVLAYAFYLYLALTFAVLLPAAGPAVSAVPRTGTTGSVSFHKAPYNRRNNHNKHPPNDDSGEIS